jgi:hypothetical protein
LKITGVYAQDIFEGGHTEIHPVYKIEYLGHSATNFPLPVAAAYNNNNNATIANNNNDTNFDEGTEEQDEEN